MTRQITMKSLSGGCLVIGRQDNDDECFLKIVQDDGTFMQASLPLKHLLIVLDNIGEGVCHD